MLFLKIIIALLFSTIIVAESIVIDAVVYRPKETEKLYNYLALTTQSVDEALNIGVVMLNSENYSSMIQNITITVEDDNMKSLLKNLNLVSNNFYSLKNENSFHSMALVLHPMCQSLAENLVSFNIPTVVYKCSMLNSVDIFSSRVINYFPTDYHQLAWALLSLIPELGVYHQLYILKHDPSGNFYDIEQEFIGISAQYRLNYMRTIIISSEQLDSFKDVIKLEKFFLTFQSIDMTKNSIMFVLFMDMLSCTKVLINFNSVLSVYKLIFICFDFSSFQKTLDLVETNERSLFEIDLDTSINDILKGMNPHYVSTILQHLKSTSNHLYIIRPVLPSIHDLKKYLNMFAETKLNRSKTTINNLLSLCDISTSIYYPFQKLLTLYQSNAEFLTQNSDIEVKKWINSIKNTDYKDICGRYQFFDSIGNNWPRLKVLSLKPYKLDIMHHGNILSSYRSNIHEKPYKYSHKTSVFSRKDIFSFRFIRFLTNFVASLFGIKKIILTLAVFLNLSILIGLWVYNYRYLGHDMFLNIHYPWMIEESEIFVREKYIGGNFSTDNIEDSNANIMTLYQSELEHETPEDSHKGFFDGKDVNIHIYSLSHDYIKVKKEIYAEINRVYNIQHENLNTFVAAFHSSNVIGIITNYYTRKNLNCLLSQESHSFTKILIISLTNDLVRAMNFLHSSDIQYHGNLSSKNCYIDSRWVLKLKEFGLPTLCSKDTNRNNYCQLAFSDTCMKCPYSLWKSPEILESRILNIKQLKQSDIYSFGIILQELHTKKSPWKYTNLSNCEIIDRIRCDYEGFRTTYPLQNINRIEGAGKLYDIMINCLTYNPLMRPTISTLRTELLQTMNDNGIKTNIVDNVVKLLSTYTHKLSKEVSLRTVELNEERSKIDNLLERILPKKIADQLAKGIQVDPETYDQVTIYFSDIVGFTELSATKSPLDVVNFLNDLYTKFDMIAHRYNVYKIETIGDAYVAASGLPERNGDQHAYNICKMACDVMKVVGEFFICGENNLQVNIQIRVGIHTGKVVAGVVGRKMPRYTLFGETVQTASRMEQTSKPLKIQLSETTYEIIKKYPEFITKPRKVKNVKNQHSLKTYWLIGTKPTENRSTSTNSPWKTSVMSSIWPSIDEKDAEISSNEEIKREEDAKQIIRTTFNRFMNWAKNK